jgi:hypothetical protein
VAQLAEAAQAWQRRAQKLEQQLQASEEQQRSQLAGASAQYAAQLQVRGYLLLPLQLLICWLAPVSAALTLSVTDAACCAVPVLCDYQASYSM